MTTHYNSVHSTGRRTKAAMAATLAGPALDLKMIANNTLRYRRPDGTTVYRLHETDILAVRPRGGFTINTGGYNTHTTRARLNVLLPAGWTVYTHKGRIHLRHVANNAAWPFLRTVTVTAKGIVRPDVKPSSLDTLARQLDAYMAEWKRKGMPADSAGDPWIFHPSQIDRSVMLDWVKSRYVFRNMLGYAQQHAGMSDTGIAYTYARVDQRGLDKYDLARIRRFVRAKLGLAT